MARKVLSCLFSARAGRRILLRMAGKRAEPEIFSLSGDHESRVTQLLQVTRHQLRVAQTTAAPRMYEALAELDNILEDQIAALADAVVDDETDAERQAAGPPDGTATDLARSPPARARLLPRRALQRPPRPGVDPLQSHQSGDRQPHPHGHAGCRDREGGGAPRSGQRLRVPEEPIRAARATKTSRASRSKARR